MRKPLLAICILFFLSATAQTVQKLPPNSRIIYFGDSQTSYAYGSNGNSVQYQNYGYAAWVNALAPGAQTPKGGILGVPGETTTQMLNRLSAIQTFAPKLMVVLAGTNDPLYGISPETTKANLRKIYDAGLSAGARVIAITILPRFGSNAYSATNETNRKAINEWIKAQGNVTVVDAENDLNAAIYFDDGLHPSPWGAYILGNKVATVVNQVVQQCITGSAPASDLSIASNSNPYLTGSGGSKNTASGTVADNWELAGNLTGGALVAGTKETDLTGREHQAIVVSGTYTGSGRQASFNNYASSPAALSAGKVVEGVGELEVVAPFANIKAVYLKVIVYSSNWSILAEANSMFPTSASPLYMPPGKYLLRTPAMTIGSGTIGLVTTQVVIEFTPTAVASPVSASVKLSSAGIRSLPLAPGPLAVISPAGIIPICPGNTVQLQATTGTGYAYQWLYNDAPISSAAASTYTAKDQGSYTVRVSTTACAVLSEPTILRAGDCPPYIINTGLLPSGLCIGGAVNVPFTTSDVLNEGNVFTAQLSDANGSFAAPLSIGTLAGTSSGTIAATLPSTLPPGAGYRIRVVSSIPAIVGTDNGEDININAVPVMTSSLAPPAICNNAVFSYTPSATPSTATFSWSRASVAGISNAAATGNGGIQEQLLNTTSSPVNVVYVYTVSNNGCGAVTPYQVVLQVNPSPVVKTKNISVNLDAAGKAVITPQEIDNGSVAYCGPLQYSLDKAEFTCNNIGTNTVTLRITDANNNTGTGSAVVTVTDPFVPVITNAAASPSVLTPVNGKMINVSVNYTAADNCLAPNVVLYVKSNEPEGGLFRGDKSPDWKIVNNRQVQLRAESDPKGTGRVYTISIVATDAIGNKKTQDVLVTVPAAASASKTESGVAELSPSAVVPVSAKGLHLSVQPNPANAQFSLLIASNQSLPASIKVMDASGRIVETRQNVAVNNRLVIGERYRPGLYLVEVMQGKERTIQRVLKLQ